MLLAEKIKARRDVKLNSVDPEIINNTLKNMLTVVEQMFDNTYDSYVYLDITHECFSPLFTIGGISAASKFIQPVIELLKREGFSAYCDDWDHTIMIKVVLP
jgi:hypothetical protein